MAIRSDITPEALWFMYTKRTFTITVTDATNNAVNLAAVNVKWRVMRNAEYDVWLEKTVGSGLAIGGAGNNVVTITVDPDSNDYINIIPGRRYHELIDLDSDDVYSFGDAYIHARRSH